MFTTLTNRQLSAFTLKYKFFDKKLILFIETEADHGIYGSANIDISGCEVINMYSDVHSLISDVFNKAYNFLAVSPTGLEVCIPMANGLEESSIKVEVSNNGEDEIGLSIENADVILPKGKYKFSLLGVEDLNFDGAKIAIQEQNIAYVGSENSYDGSVDYYDQNGVSPYLSIDGQILNFSTSVKISITDSSSDTNIPILIDNR